MRWLQKLFRKNTHCQGIVGISFLPQGMTIAISNYMKDNGLKLIFCEFIETKKTEDCVLVLKKWVAEYKLEDYHCHLVLNIDDYRRVNIEAPEVPDNEIALAIRWKINELIDFPVDDAMIDYYPVPVFSENRSMLEVIASPRKTITSQIEQCTEAGLSIKVIDIQETTLRNLAVLLRKNQRGVAVLYLQKNFGIILVQKRGVIYVARKIAIGYEKLHLEEKYAMDNSASAVLNNLALEIRRSLDYVESYYRLGVISELAIVPWSDDTQKLVENLKNDHGIIAYLMDLATMMDCDIKLDYPTQSVCAPAIGATLRNLVTTA
jgi:MSHA biogenesis protein MshI